MKKTMMFILFLFSFLLVGCGEVQSEYHEVHVIVVEDTLFYYIDPSEGKDTLSANQLGSGKTLFVYLYESKEGIDFGYDQYFQTISNRYVETNAKTGKLYVLASEEIDNLINEYFMSKPE